MTQFKKNLMKNRLWLLLFIIVLFSVSVTAAQNKVVVIPLFGDEQSDIEALKARIAILEAKLVYMSIESGTVNGLSGPHVIFTGANVHIRSGSDSTDDNGALKGLGNLIVGYNEERSSINDRTGSHNIVVGAKNNFSSYGGLVVGYSILSAALSPRYAGEIIIRPAAIGPRSAGEIVTRQAAIGPRSAEAIVTQPAALTPRLAGGLITRRAVLMRRSAEGIVTRRAAIGPR
jgi:hypothetical protein